MAKATQMLTDTLIWRKDFGADNLLDEAIDDSVLGSVSYIYRTDKEGRPVCYNFYGDIDQEKVFGDKDKFIRWRVQVMERGVQLIDFVNTDSMVVVHDYKNASLFGRSSNAKAATKEIIKIMQDNYPEFLVRCQFKWPYSIFTFTDLLHSNRLPNSLSMCLIGEQWFSSWFVHCYLKQLPRNLWFARSKSKRRKFLLMQLNSNSQFIYSDELHQSLANVIDEANLPKDYQKTNITKEKEIPIVSKQEQEKIEKASSADITTSEAAAAPVTDVPVGPESKVSEEPITKVEPTTAAADNTAEGSSEAANVAGTAATNNTTTNTTS